MQVILEVQSGLQRGKRLWLRAGQAAEIGRSCLSDLAIEHDLQMSDLHFKVATEQHRARLEDLCGAGTRVNGQSMRRITLHSGDTITAGETSFRVHINGASEEIDSRCDPVQPVAVTRPTFSTEKAESGLYWHRGDTGVILPADLNRRLREDYRQTMIVDTSVLTSAVQDQLAEQERLFDWLVGDGGVGGSIVVVTNCEQCDCAAVIDDSWGKDALVTVFVNIDEEALVEQVRRAAGTFARPSLVRPQLADVGPHAASYLLAGIEAVLIEDASAECWVLISKSNLRALLEELHGAAA